MNEYQKLAELQKKYEAALNCTCVCHHVRGINEQKICCVATCNHVEDLKEQVRLQHVRIRALENG